MAIGTDSEATPGCVSPELAYLQGDVGRMNLGARHSIREISDGMGMRKSGTKPLTYVDMVAALANSNWGARGFESVGEMPSLADALVESGWSDENLTVMQSDPDAVCNCDQARRVGLRRNEK